MIHGPLLGKILIFTIPLMASSILQLLFNAADIVVVGRFAGSEALAAVGSTGALINLLTNVFMGLSVGANVLVARYYGAGQQEEASETVHTSILLSIVAGLFLAVVGIVFAAPLLRMMGTPEDVLPLAALYIQIYFVGMPVVLIYNYGSAILRAIGDTKRPLYYLAVAGALNVVLNLIFVIPLQMSVAGVALATILSQALSAVLVLRCLMRAEGGCHLDLHRLRIYKTKLKKILQLGLPAGFQGSIFSLSNVLIQSSVNSFGSIAMAGNSAAANIEGFTYVAMNSFHQAAITFVSQNMGAMEFKRIRKVAIQCLICVVITGATIGNLSYLFGNTLLGIYSSDPQVIQYGMVRLSIIGTTYFLCGIMDVGVGCLRGINYSVLPMIVSLLGACGMRIIWIFTIFRRMHDQTILYISYPISWFITSAVHIICFVLLFRRMVKRFEMRE
ncbi:MAG: MATE family efflux transporter [Lachnospiraceae bacterium]|nr:MATE family efflux transporter [Lachnospiraceae bacterium]